MMTTKGNERKSWYSINKLQKAAAYLSIAAAVTACDGMIPEENDNNNLEESMSNIVNGTELSVQEARNSGIVWLSVGCSGTVLNSRWILTAQHCVNGYLNAPETLGVHFGHSSDSGAENRQPKRIITNPNGNDTALIELSSDAPSFTPPAGRYQNGRMLIYGMDDSKLNGATVRTIGYGKNVGPNGAPYTGSGTLRYGSARISSANSSLLYISSDNAPTGLACNGDSGGPLFLEVWGTNAANQGGLIATYMVGVTSTSDCSNYSGYPASGSFRTWVESTVFGTPSSRIDCKSTSCASTPKALPNSTWAHQGFNPYSASVNECYFAKATYNFEQNKDFLTVGNGKVSGNGSYGTHWCGVLPLSLTTNGSVSSKGLSSISLSNRTTQTMPSSAQCAGVTGGYQGCRGTGCHACIEALNAYPKYFKNHPKCIPNTTCGSYSTGLCSANCPAPTSKDR